MVRNCIKMYKMYKCIKIERSKKYLDICIKNKLWPYFTNIYYASKFIINNSMCISFY